MTGEIHATIRLARQCPITTRQRTPEVQVFDIFLAVKAVVSRQAGPPEVELPRKDVKEFRSRSPEEAEAQFPGWLGIRVKSGGVQSELVEKKLGKCGCCSLANANHSDIGALNGAQGQARKATAQSQSREKSGAACAQDKNIGDHAAGDKRPPSQARQCRVSSAPRLTTLRSALA